MKKSVIFFALSLSLLAGGLTACNNSDNDNGNSNQNQNQSGVKAKSIKSELARVDSTISNDKLSAFVNNQYNLNFDLIRASSEQLHNDNAMISTFSIQMALAMTWGGADGDTASEMASALHLDADSHSALNKLDSMINLKNKLEYDNGDKENPEHKDAVEIKTSNNMYFATDTYTWSEDWLNLLATNYGAGLQEMDFASDPEAARKYINDVVSNDTHNRINNLLPEKSITLSTQSVITNAIYFKAPWKDNVSEGGSIDFHKLDGSSVSVDCLTVSENYLYMADSVSNMYQAVSVPLRDNDFNVMFILPAEGKFNEVQESLNGTVVSSIFDNFSDETKINLKFPSYSFETSLSLKAPLKSLGMVKAFDASNADFSKMTKESNDLFVDDIYHKTFIGLDKNGVEASAATAVVIARETAELNEPINLDLDRPYIFVIYESESRTPLFVGRVMDPSKK